MPLYRMIPQWCTVLQIWSPPGPSVTDACRSYLIRVASVLMYIMSLLAAQLSAMWSTRHMTAPTHGPSSDGAFPASPPPASRPWCRAHPQAALDAESDAGGQLQGGRPPRVPVWIQSEDEAAVKLSQRDHRLLQGKSVADALPRTHPCTRHSTMRA